MINCLQYISGNKFKYLLVSGLAISFTACVNNENGPPTPMSSTANHALANQNHIAGSLERNPEMDKLASDLTKYGDVSRIVNSIVVKLPDSSLFRDGRLVSITPHGKLRLAYISHELRDYPNSLIYVLGYMPVGNVELAANLRAKAKVDVVKRELLSHHISPSRMYTQIEQGNGNVGGSSLDGRYGSGYSVELHIVPNQFKP